MSRKTRKTLITAAINAGAYGQDAIDNGATPVAIQTSGLEITPIEGSEIDRELDNDQLGNSPVMLIGTHVKASGSVELAGSGDATTPPAYQILINAAGYDIAPTLDSVDYQRITDNSEPDATFIVYKDGAYHKIKGARVNFSTSLKIGELPKLNFEITGLYNGIVEGALPAADFSAFIKPVPVGSTHTSVTLAGNQVKMLEFELNENNEIAYDENTVEEAVYLTDFKPDGKLVIEAPSLSTLNPFDLALKEQLTTLAVTHGTAAGNIVEISAAEIQIGRPTYGDKDGRMTYDIPFRVIGSHTLKTK